ncbi:MAG: hypothetical protein V4577_15120 [Bacteroidota bacterium]
MKKFLIIIMLLGLTIEIAPALQAATDINLAIGEQPQTDTVKHTVYKKRKPVVRKVSSTKAARINKQLRQADKHLRDEKKVQKAQQELKKDTTTHH